MLHNKVGIIAAHLPDRIFPSVNIRHARWVPRQQVALYERAFHLYNEMIPKMVHAVKRPAALHSVEYVGDIFEMADRQILTVQQSSPKHCISQGGRRKRRDVY